jgi:hypothetical protein
MAIEPRLPIDYYVYAISVRAKPLYTGMHRAKACRMEDPIRT